MANNNFKAFAAAAGANVMTQADYEALAALLTGFQSGTAQSQQLNKVWRQSSIMAAVLAQFIVDLTGQDAIDDGTTATLLANLKMAVQAQSVAVVGQARNVSMSVTAGSSTATLTADEIVVGAALGGKKYVLGAFSKTINLAATGAGGMDTGSAPASGFVALYAIYNPTTGTSALLATNATSTVAPSVYGGANMPSGYTASALVSVWATTSGSLLAIGLQNDRAVSIFVQSALNSSTQQPTMTALNIAAIVPKNARSISGVLHIGSTAASSGFINVASSSNSVGQQNLGTYVSQTTVPIESPFSNLQIITPQTMYYVATTASGTMSAVIYISGYSF
ncbi:hypothetical protein [Burkholderia sp. BE17]|uniref:hypothetical protein n=1 Tax=Burkholderia sp. BE17 TaxID=2656644 RepID=UPI00187B904B|nr:hypothetical protein [Burkholderia sp. BE17]